MLSPEDTPMGRDCSLRRDPIERDPKIRRLVREAEKEAETELAARGQPKIYGYCRSLWTVQKRILKEKYGIKWRTPAEMNPDVEID